MRWDLWDLAEGAIKLLLRVVVPGSPAWLASVLVGAAHVLFITIRDLEGKDLTKPQKRAVAAAAVGDLLDGALDEVPRWSHLGEQRRDRIINGLVELSLFIVREGQQDDGERHVENRVRTLIARFVAPEEAVEGVFHGGPVA